MFYFLFLYIITYCYLMWSNWKWNGMELHEVPQFRHTPRVKKMISAECRMAWLIGLFTSCFFIEENDCKCDAPAAAADDGARQTCSRVCVNRMQISISRGMEWEFSPKGQSLARIRHHNCHSYALGGSIAYNTDVVYMWSGPLLEVLLSRSKKRLCSRWKG